MPDTRYDVELAALTAGSGTADGSISAAKLATNAVTTVKITDANVTTAKVADAAVTLAKMANLAQDKIIGRATASTGVPEVITCTSFGRSFLAKSAAVTVTGARNDPEGALASLLTQLATLGIVTNSTTAS